MKHHKKIIRLAIGFLLFIPGIMKGQITKGKPFAEHLRPNVVKITTQYDGGSEEHGFGFISGEYRDSLFIITADHVVNPDAEFNPTHELVVEFFRGQKERAKYILGDPDRDIALLSVRKPYKYQYEVNAISNSVRIGQTVRFIGRGTDWFVPSPKFEGEITEIDPVNNQISLGIISVQPGTSGAPLLNDCGIIGMIIEDNSANEAMAVNIELIQRIVTKGRFINRFSLTEAQFTTQTNINPFPQKGIGISLLVLGIVSTVTSLGLDDGNDLYQAYRDNTDPDAAVFAQMSRQDFYDEANKKHKLKAWIQNTGIGLVVTGTAALIINGGLRKKQLTKNELCQRMDIQLYPLIGHSPVNPSLRVGNVVGMGINFSF